MNKRPHILFLFSDTGGGHRAAAEALTEAVALRYGDSVTTEMVDIFKEYAPRPLNRMPDWYPYMVKAPELWGASFRITDGRARARAITATFWPVAARYARQIIDQHPCDLVVTVHPFGNSFILKALGSNRPPFITVVTDMVTTHALWFDQRADVICVPTEIARERAIEYSMPPEKVIVTGQPIAAKYCAPVGDKLALRKSLGWPADKFTVVAVGGGDGMGPLAQTARAIGESGLDLSLVVVTGRNQRLKKSLQARKWAIPAFIYGFTHELPDFMRAADVLVTKAGPGTIAESLAAHLPLILYARLPGQEDGNVTFVRHTNTGVWAPTPQRVVATLRRWYTNPAERQKVVNACIHAARPDASNEIAQIIGRQLGLEPSPE
ncbi:MAG: glycosyltransferase [Anaerolineales bacterium]|nr:glycosyltransferase [Anaerolineales bacterium]